MYQLFTPPPSFLQDRNTSILHDKEHYRSESKLKYNISQTFRNVATRFMEQNEGQNFLMNSRKWYDYTILKNLAPNLNDSRSQSTSEVIHRSDDQYIMIASAFGLGKEANHEDLIRNLELGEAQELMPCGEDAYFISKNGIGVADGVGSWSRYGIDPGVMARALMLTCKHHVDHLITSDLNENVARNVLDQAFNDVVKSGKVYGGSCTAVIAILDHNVLHTANLGDSGFMIYRPNNLQIVYRSRTQQHGFNFPYQLTIVPPERKRTSNARDQPKDAFIKDVQLQDGDFIIMGSDGLFDNLFDTYLQNIIHETITNDEEYLNLNAIQQKIFI